MTDIVIAVAAKVSECLVAPIGRQLSYLFCYRSYTDELINKVQELGHTRGDLQITVDEAIRRGDEIRPIVNDWLSRADGITGEAEELMKDENKSCFNGWCPNLKSRYQLSREAKQKTQFIVQIQEARNFPDGVSYRVPAKNVAFKNYEAFESRATTLNKVMDALKDEKMKMIGVWGMGGVGKTTLVKQVAKLAEDNKLFDKVVMATVSREQNLGNIQTELADFLALKIEEKSRSGRANRQSEILKKKKLLIILDDIWAKLDLEAVGIPHGDDDVECKIVVTSRSIDVLSQDMGTQQNFEIRILSQDEAWQLFQNTAGGILEFDVQSVARKVAEKCGGLPIALVTVAKALKNKSLPWWEDALRQLTSPVKTDIRGMDENVYRSLELSYDSLEIEDAKSLFLLCGLMGYGDISLDDLFKYSLGLGLFQSIKTLDKSTNRLQVLVDSLKASSLLLDIDKEEYVKMHDVVRDVARQLASKDPRWFVLIEATQSGIHESTRYIPLSLSQEGTLDLGERLDHPKIEFFLLHNEGPLKIPDPLFNGMGKLKVLHLFQMEFSSLPLSLQSLANLRTLCLDCCTLGDVAGIGELKKLEVLSFMGSDIVQLPREIAQLTCLRWLDLSNCRQLQVIPPNILSNLSQLEHLCMKPSSFTLSNQESNACLAELKHLSRLTTLNIALQDLKLLPKDMVFEKLTGYKIFIGGEWDLYSPCETKRALKLNDVNRSLRLVDGIGKLLKKTEELFLRELSGTKSVFYELDREDFLQLKHLNVCSSPAVQYIVDSKYPRVQEHVLFPKLESLLLDDLINLEKVCHGPIPKGSFGNLKTLEVRKCRGLKIFLSLTMATGFLHLQNIEIEFCDIMQQIIAYEMESEIIEDGHAGTTLQLFPKLQSLKLNELPELMNFSAKLEDTSSTSLTSNARSEGKCDSHMSFFSHKVLFSNLEKLELYDLPKLKEIWHHQLPLGSFYNLQILKVYDCPGLLNLIPSYLIHNLNHLKGIDVDDCEVLKHVFDLQGLDGNIRLLPKLESLWLWTLPKLRCTIYNEDEDKNDSVRCLFPPSTLKVFHNLKFLSIGDCWNEVQDEEHVSTLAEDVVLFNEKVLFPNLENLYLNNLPKLKEIWHHQLSLDSFSNLQILRVIECSRLLNLIPCHLIQNFKNLKEIQVSDCEVLKHVFDFQGLDGNVEILPKLETLRLKGLHRLKSIICNGDKNDSMRCLFSSPILMDFQNLKHISINYCAKEEEEEGHVNTPTQDIMLFGEKVSFPNLEELQLNGLPMLKMIWHHQISIESFCKLQILSVHNCPCLVNLVPSHLIQSFQNLKKVDVCDCEVLEHVFDHRGPNGDLGILPKIEILKLGELPRLRLIICNEDKNDNMRCLLSPSKFNDFHHLKELHIIDCGMLLDEKVSLPPNFEVLVLKALPKLEEIDVGILSKFKILGLEKLPRLRHIICNEDKNATKRRLLSPSMFTNFHNLKELHIIDFGMEDGRDVYTPTNDVVLSNEKASFLDDGASNYEAFESRASTFNNIMDALRDHLINLIGVVGFGGVGKTTLLKQVAQQAKQLQLFKRQAYIDLSSIPDSEKLRQEIANALGFRLWGEDESRKADQLKQRLKGEKILIILDHIWKEVDLEQVGIPSKGFAQCKILLASRDGGLLCKDMGAQTCFPLEHLPPEEAWHLFKKTAGDSVEENLQQRPIAIQVVEECKGLPIAIVTIAKALKDESVAVWQNALDELRSSAPTNIRGVDDKVYRCLKWSYNHLKGNEVKSLFLLCGSLSYNDISMDHLLQYGMGLDLFDRIDSLEQARNRLLALLEILKASSLFMDADNKLSLLFMDADNKFVRIHDVLYDVARDIVSKDPHRFVVREDVGLEEWSETDESKRCTFISLNCKAVPELPHGLVCPELQFFLLHNNNPSLNIPNTFFQGMKNLKVLDLSKMPFTTLPSSLDSLANLRTLRLDGCELVDIALIGKLTKLEVLSLAGSTIQQLPNEMVQLTNLRLLDLNDCRKLEVIPRNILSSLSRLECLYVKSSFTQWAVEGESNACLSELNHLSHLTTLSLEIPDVKLLPKDILFENLTRYSIFMGGRKWYDTDNCKTKRALTLKGVNISLYLGDGINKLLERSEELEFGELSGTKYVLHPSDRESFLELKHLLVSWSPEIQYIIDSKDLRFPQHGTFPLHNLEEVRHGPIPTGPFGNLKTLHVSFCDGLKFLFLPSTARGLSQLEEMKIQHCYAMQSIIAYERGSEIEEDGHVGTNLQLFPKLRSLKLENLLQLINFSSELETTYSTSLSTNARSEGSFFNHQVSFPKLEELELKDLPKLKDIWHHQLPFGSFCNLQILRVYNCSCLLNLVPSHLIQSFKNLKEIDVKNCKLLEHVVILQGIDGNVEILPKLETLNLKDLPKLRWIEDGNDSMKYISSPVTLMNIQNLKELHIINCRMEDR